MKLAISNLAWDQHENQKVVPLLSKHKINAIEVAPSKVKNFKDYRNFWDNHNIKIVAITSLLYGHPELTLFQSPSIRNKTLEYLKKQAETSHILGAEVMMFGSPKNRIRGNIKEKDAYKIASEFFNALCDFTSQYKIFLAFEPNPPIYGGDFVHTTDEAIKLTKLVNHKYFGLNLDSSTICSNSTNYNAVVKKAIPHAVHAHISEPFLKPIPNNETDHQAFAHALTTHKYDKWLSIEMPLPQDTDHIKQIEKTLKFVTSTYN